MRYVVPILVFAAAACGEAPTATEETIQPPVAVNPAPPNSCDAYAPLSATMRDLTGDALRSDGGGAYVEGENGVEAHINGPTGNFSIWTTESSRRLVATTPSGGTVNIDRVYTNTHSVTCGLRLSTLPTNSTAVLEAEEREGGTKSTISRLRYGKACDIGTATGSLVTVTRVNATTIVISGTSGVYCTKNNRNKFVYSGMVGPFEMTLVAQ